MIGYKKVGDCTYPTLSGHTLRRKNLKLIQFVKAIKSNIGNERELKNSTIDRNISNEFPSNTIISNENISKDTNGSSGSSSVDVFADEDSGREGMESSSSSSSQLNYQRNREEMKNVIEEKEGEVKEEKKDKEEDENYVKTYKDWEQVTEISQIKNITHSASEESNCVLDVD